MRTPHLKPLRAVLAAALLAAAAVVIAACGGGSSQDAKQTIDDAFSHPIKSANVTLNLNAKVNGVQQLQQPISVKLSGPYQSNGRGKLPSLNWQASFSGGGQSISGGLISTGDDAFVSFQGSNYEVGKAQVAQLNQQLSAQAGQHKSLKDFGIDPKSWVTNAQTQGDQTINGVDTTHVQAGVDVGKMLNDFNKVISEAGGAMGTSTPSQLSQQQIDQVKQVVTNPKFDVYVGKKDHTLRRLNVSIDFQIPQSKRSQFNGAQGGNVTFSLDFANVGQPQTIKPPANAKPLSELQGQFGGLGASGSGGISGGGASSGGSSGGSGGSGPSPQAFQKYSKCIQKANPANSAEIQKCAALLK